MTTHTTPDRLTKALAWALFLLATLAAVVPLVPPAPRADPSREGFSTARAFEHIGRIARESRPIGSPGNQYARAYIVEQLRLLGLSPELQTTSVRDYYTPSGGSIDVVNVMARIPGAASTKAVALMGHYDTVPGTYGANDNASAVATLLEVARALLAGPRLHNDVILVFTDGEEPAPRFGSSAFVAWHPWASGIGFLVNLEALGSGGMSLVAEVGGPQGWVVDQYAAAVACPAAFSFVTATAELIGGSNSDFAAFQGRGMPSVEFAYLHGSPVYHTPNDAPDRVSPRSLEQQGANALALTRHLGDADLREPTGATSASVFLTVARRFVLRYPVAWALPLALGAGAILAAAGWRDRAWLRVLQSSGATLVTAVVAAVAAAAIWMALAGWRDSMGLGESYAYLACLVALVVGIGAAVARLARRRVSAGADALGVLLVWWVLGFFLSFFAPGMSYLLVWPVLAGGLAVLCRSQRARARWLQLAAWALVAGTTLVLLVPAIDVFYQLAQPRPGNLDSQALPFVAVPALLLALGAELLRAFRVRRREPKGCSS